MAIVATSISSGKRARENTQRLSLLWQLFNSVHHSARTFCFYMCLIVRSSYKGNSGVSCFARAGGGWGGEAGMRVLFIGGG